VQDLLKKHFGYDAFRPLQEEIIRTVLENRDALVLMPTGGGKSLCYQLPALAFPGITLVISPLIALMKDQVDALMANGIPAAFLNSTLDQDEAEAVEAGALSGQLKILYVAPERLSSPGFQSLLRRLHVSFIAVDEAHCISEWGHDFRPDYRQLGDLRRAFRNVPVMALTATATPRVREDIVRQLGLEAARSFVSSFNRPNLRYSVRPKNNSFGQLVELLRSYADKPAIVYCFSRKDTEALAGDLREAGFQALPYHAGLDRETRKRTQERFIRDEVPIIVATIAFGMGIDKPDVRLVAHMDLPKTIEGYYQETGRAGRDGLASECVLFYTFGDRRKQEFFIMQIEDEAERALAFKKLAQVVEYCESSACRRKLLLEYFGEAWNASSCAECDNCVAPAAESHDATEIAQKILSAVLRTGESFGAAYVCDVLRGSRRERIIENRHDALSVYGIARNVPAERLREYMGSLQRAGYLDKNPGDYPTLRVTKKGRDALADRSRISLPKPREAAVISRPKDRDSVAYDHDLFELLRAERKAVASSQDVPPFVIFGDRTLQEMSYYFPRSLESMAGIFGVGATKLEQYGDVFLAIIRSHADARNLPERPRQDNALFAGPKRKNPRKSASYWMRTNL
jgi:ATP-dependent DNA helicase RecQ